MRAGLPTILTVVLSVAAVTRAAEDAIDGGPLTLQPATNAPLRAVPDHAGYESLWNSSPAGAAVVQTSLTQAAIESDTGSVVTADAVAASEDETSIAVGDSPRDGAEDQPAAAGEQPFIDLLNHAPEPAPSLASADSETNDMFVRLAVWTVIILCLCVLTMLALRRWQRRQGILPERGGQSRVLETLAIGPGRAVSLVQLGDVRAVVGTDGSGIRTIVLAPPAFEEELAELNDEPPDFTPEHAA